MANIQTADADFRQKMIEGAGLLTARIYYHLPDHPSLLQQFIWQQMDIAPAFPHLQKFLLFWRTEIVGAIHSVEICHANIIGPREFRNAKGLLIIN